MKSKQTLSVAESIRLDAIVTNLGLGKHWTGPEMVDEVVEKCEALVNPFVRGLAPKGEVLSTKLATHFHVKFEEVRCEQDVSASRTYTSGRRGNRAFFNYAMKFSRQKTMPFFSSAFMQKPKIQIDGSPSLTCSKPRIEPIGIDFMSCLTESPNLPNSFYPSADSARTTEMRSRKLLTLSQAPSVFTERFLILLLQPFEINN